MGRKEERLNTTIALGGGWKATVTRADLDLIKPHDGSPAYHLLQTWCGCARTNAHHVTIYDEIEEGESLAMAEVIFEPAWRNFGDGWRLQYAGRTYVSGSPGSGEGGKAETELLAVVPIGAMLNNIFVLSMLEERAMPTKEPF